MRLGAGNRVGVEIGYPPSFTKISSGIARAHVLCVIQHLSQEEFALRHCGSECLFLPNNLKILGLASQTCMISSLTSPLWWILSHLRFCQLTTRSIYVLCMNANRFLICPIQANIEEIMVILTSAVSNATPMSLLSQGDVPRQCPTQIVISLSSHPRLENS